MTITPFVYVVEQTGDDDTGIGVRYILILILIRITMFKRPPDWRSFFSHPINLY